MCVTAQACTIETVRGDNGLHADFIVQADVLIICNGPVLKK